MNDPIKYPNYFKSINKIKYKIKLDHIKKKQKFSKSESKEREERPVCVYSCYESEKPAEEFRWLRSPWTKNCHHRRSLASCSFVYSTESKKTKKNLNSIRNSRRFNFKKATRNSAPTQASWSRRQPLSLDLPAPIKVRESSAFSANCESAWAFSVLRRSRAHGFAPRWEHQCTMQ